MNHRLLLAATAIILLTTPATAASIGEAVKADMPSLMTMYRDFHANPELSMQEVRTPAKLAAEMKKLGFTVTEKVGKTGVVAVLKRCTAAAMTPTSPAGSAPRACLARAKPNGRARW